MRSPGEKGDEQAADARDSDARTRAGDAGPDVLLLPALKHFISSRVPPRPSRPSQRC